MRNVVCPYCFERFEANKAPFRCIISVPTKCEQQDDLPLGQFQRLVTPRKLPRVFDPPSNMLRATGEAKCPECETRSPKRVCPHCHNDLPSQFLSTESLSVALVGTKESGKSHYVAVLIEELRRSFGRRFNAALNEIDDRTRDRYTQDFGRYLFHEHIVIPATRSALAQIDVKYPLLYRLSMRPKPWRVFNRLRERAARWMENDLRVWSLVFYDTAGEDLDSFDVMVTETNYIANADGIIFLIDPLQIPWVRDRLDGQVALPQMQSDPQHVVSRVADLIRTKRGLDTSAPISTPVALAFSKIDALRSLIDPSSPIYRAAQQDGFFDRNDAAQMHASMHSYLAEWVPQFETYVQHNFRRHAYFGLSALGAAPDEDGHLRRGIAPFRVEDPFLWIVHTLGLVPSK